MSFRDDLHERARRVDASVVLAEGWDERVREAGRVIASSAIAQVEVLEASLDSDQRSVDVQDLLIARRPDRVRDRSHAAELAKNPLLFAAGLVALGKADAAVAGAVHATADVLRAALWTIGPAEGVTTVSSAFYMILPGSSFPLGAGTSAETSDRVITFTDAAVVPDPSAEQLAEIAAAAAHDRRLVVGDEPVVAFLSYSTKGSAAGPGVQKMRDALDRFRRLCPGVVCDGELQADAALVPDVARRKAPESPVGGKATILVFPDLDSGNIAYKLVQRLGGADAIGPIIQGLRKPVADLSRGATVSDIVDVAAVAVLQASDSPRNESEEDT
ncbi:MAG: phosphate acyltransferase [Gemmatimonadales bacterium]